MEELDRLKSSRTAAKRSVTVAAKGLKTAVDLQMDSIPSLVATLESKFLHFLEESEIYSDFCHEKNIATDDSIVNGLDICSYEDDVKSVYKSAISAYRSSLEPVVTQPAATQSVPVHLKRR